MYTKYKIYISKRTMLDQLCIHTIQGTKMVQLISTEYTEDIQKRFNSSLKRRIDENIRRADFVVVLVDLELGSYRQQKYEIETALRLNKLIFGIQVSSITSSWGLSWLQDYNPTALYNQRDACLDLLNAEKIKLYKPSSFDELKSKFYSWYLAESLAKVSRSFDTTKVV